MRHYACSRFTIYRNKKKAAGVPSPRRGFAKLSDDEIDARIRAAIKGMQARHPGTVFTLTAESYANDYQVPVHRITQSFCRLNQEGLLGHRMTGSVRTDHAWSAKRYPTK